MPDSGIFKLCQTMLKTLTDYAKIMPENFTKIYTINVIMLDLSQKGSNYARIMLDHGVTMPELCQKSDYARIMLDRF